MAAQTPSNLWELIRAGGFIMWPLLLGSLAIWGVILERGWALRGLSQRLSAFHLEAMNVLLRDVGAPGLEALKRLASTQAALPTAQLALLAVERLSASDARVRERWSEAVERRRQVLNQELKQGLWVLGTLGSSAPFVGLFGTVVGILRSFQEMAKTGTGGFAVVAAGISEALIATAVGILVAVIAVMAYNAFQTRCSQLILLIRLQMEELSELMEIAAASRSQSQTESRG